MLKPSGGWRGQTGSRHERGYGSAWDKLRLTILTRDKHLCQPCMAEGRITPARMVDHIKAKAEGGTDDPNNLRAICPSCHADKTTQEGHKAAGHRTRPTFDANGWPIWE